MAVLLRAFRAEMYLRRSDWLRILFAMFWLADFLNVANCAAACYFLTHYIKLFRLVITVRVDRAQTTKLPSIKS